jgi:hypothetical protein
MEPEIPNNLGPLLLFVASLPLLPLGIGVPLLLLSLMHVRTWEGEPAFPRLNNKLRHLMATRTAADRLAIAPEERSRRS